MITLNFDECDEEKEEEEVNKMVEEEEEVEERRGGGDVWTRDHRGSDSCAASFAPTTYNSGAFSEVPNESLVMSGFYNNGESGNYYCDSDSGVSSMYESIQRGGGNQGEGSSGTKSS